MDADDKTEDATPQKIEKALEKGNIAKSQDLTTAVILLMGSVYLLLFGATVMARLRAVIRDHVASMDDTTLTLSSCIDLCRGVFDTVVSVSGPLLIFLTVASVAMSILQNGKFRFVSEALTFKPEKLLPSNGVKKIFSVRGMVKTLAALVKLAVIVGGLYLMLHGKLDEIALFSQLSLEESMGKAANLVAWLFVLVALLLVGIGLVDYSYQRYQWHKNLRMSKHEIKDEHKAQEGDVKVKARMREQQRRVANGTLADAVASAAVVVTNPTHVAVALAYEQGGSSAPTVVAKGLDRVAELIKRLAREKNVPIIEQPPLARALFRDVALGMTIPEHLYRAVANLLAFVYRVRQARRRG